ncbi:dimethylarginine dimethylaminohydrolase family protein [Paraburkholderia sp. EG287A]|uniref:dimethylarginine dimethylaminohydrolase family protein n=1 Tax=unclassified Paraburkholderia TaxID=2615204 RepID=UPI0034D24B51
MNQISSGKVVEGVDANAFLDSEYGRLTEVLVCDATYYDWARSNTMVIGALDAGKTADVAAAMSQHRELRSALAEAGVICRLLEQDPHLFYQTYTRDSSVMTPFGLLLCQMARPERQGEWGPIVDFCASSDISVWKKVTAGSLEGGDVQILSPGQVLIGVNEVRTTYAAAQQVAAWFAEAGWQTRFIKVPAYFLHLDVLFSVVNDKVALCATDILDPDDVAWLRERYELVDVGYREVMSMGANAVALGDDRVLSSKQNPRVNAALRAQGFHVFDPDLEQFVIEGGAAHCLTMPLRRNLVGGAK